MLKTHENPCLGAVSVEVLEQPPKPSFLVFSLHKHFQNFIPKIVQVVASDLDLPKSRYSSFCLSKCVLFSTFYLLMFIILFSSFDVHTCLSLISS